VNSHVPQRRPTRYSWRPKISRIPPSAVMDYQALRSLPEMFFLQSQTLADKPFLWRKREGVFRPLT